jgi:hypothetical protein
MGNSSGCDPQAAVRARTQHLDVPEVDKSAGFEDSEGTGPLWVRERLPLLQPDDIETIQRSDIYLNNARIEPPMAAQFRQLVQNGIPMDPETEMAIWRLLVGEAA